MKLSFSTYTLPAYWASALINNDNSGLTEAEITQIAEFIINNKQDDYYFYCIECSDESYFGRYNGIGCDLLEYTFDTSFINL